MRVDWPTVGSALMHETGCGLFFSDTLRPEFRSSQGLTPRHTLGCLDAAETISAGSHRNDSGWPIAEFVFR